MTLVDWFGPLLRSGVDLHSVDAGFFSRTIPEREGIMLHERMHGSRLRHLQHEKFKLSYYESRFYKRALRPWLEGLDRNLPVLDLGAGDGRFTELLIEMGFQKIVCTDVSVDNVLSLVDLARERNAQDRVRIVLSDAADPIFADASFQAVLCIGVLYYLGDDFENGKLEVARILRKGGLLIESEPDLEGQAVKAIAFEGLDRFAKVVKEKNFVEMYDGKEFPLRLFDRDEMRDIFERQGFDVVDTHGLSIFPLLMVVARARGGIKEAEILDREEDIDACFDYFDKNGSVYKHMIWCARKR